MPFGAETIQQLKSGGGKSAGLLSPGTNWSSERSSAPGTAGSSIVVVYLALDLPSAVHHDDLEQTMWQELSQELE